MTTVRNLALLVGLTMGIGMTQGQAAEDDALVVAETGNVGLGLDEPARQLHLSGSNAVFRMDRSVNTAAFLMTRTNSSGTVMKGFQVGTNAYGTNNGEFMISDMGTAVGGPGTRRLTIQNDGSVVFTGDAFGPGFFSDSSRQLKDNIQPLRDPVETIMKLEGVSFDWKSNGKPSIGVIAEEVAKVLPELVEKNKETGESRGVNYAAMAAVLIEVAKVQQRQIEAHQMELAELKTQVAELEIVKARLSKLETNQTPEILQVSLD